jgi:hypothetical protein
MRKIGLEMDGDLAITRTDGLTLNDSCNFASKIVLLEVYILVR